MNDNKNTAAQPLDLDKLEDRFSKQQSEGSHDYITGWNECVASIAGYLASASQPEGATGTTGASVPTWQERMNEDGLYAVGERLYAGWTAVTMARDAEIADLRAQLAAKGQGEKQCVICGSDEPRTGTCGSDDPRALCNLAAPASAHPADPHCKWPTCQSEEVQQQVADQAYRELYSGAQPADTHLLAEIRSLASSGMSYGLLADDYCSQIVAKIDAAGAQPDRGAAQAVQIFTCKGKGGEYELIGYSNGAGPKRGESIVVYSDTTKPDILYHRSAADFRERMEWLGARAASPASQPVAPEAPSTVPEKAMFWFSCLWKCARLLNLPGDEPIPSGVVAAVEKLVGAAHAQQEAAPATKPWKDHEVRILVNDLRAIAQAFHATEQLRGRISDRVGRFLDAAVAPSDAKDAANAANTCGLDSVIAWIETDDGLCQAVETAENIKSDDDAFVRLSTVKKLLQSPATSAANAKDATVPDHSEREAANAKDAARYRWLRTQPFDTWKRIGWNTWNDDPEVFPVRDEEIDAAMAIAASSEADK